MVRVAFSLSLFVAALVGLTPAAEPRRPNVIVILTDDQGYGDISGHGNPVVKTPHLDRLRSESVRFTNFHVDSFCAPTRAALMTGRYSHRVGVWRTVAGRNLLREDEVTMADVFRHNGYRTALFGKWHLGGNYPYRPMDRGFEEWLGHGDGGTGTAGDTWGNDRVNDQYVHNGQNRGIPGYETDVFFEAAIHFIRENKGRPFFVYLAPYAPHTPCTLPDRSWADRYKDVPSAVAYFFASIARIDENLGKLRQFLTGENLADNTLLVFATDNGTATGQTTFNAGMRGRKGDPYEGGHRVPCFIHWPAGGFPHGRDVPRLAAHLDLLPTLIELCSMETPQPIAFDGTSLVPLLRGSGAWPERTLVMGTPRNEITSAAPPTQWYDGVVMTDRWRLVNAVELYDMSIDAGQSENVAAQHLETVAQLTQAYQRYWASVSRDQENWQGRAVLGSDAEHEVLLTSEAWTPLRATPVAWSQGDVAAGIPSFGRWPVRVSQPGRYRLEVRRWPREVDAPMASAPNTPKSPIDAFVAGRPIRWLIYGREPVSLPIRQVRLRVGTVVLASEVKADEQMKAFEILLSAGATEIEAELLDGEGSALSGAYFVYASKI